MRKLSSKSRIKLKTNQGLTVQINQSKDLEEQLLSTKVKIRYKINCLNKIIKIG